MKKILLISLALLTISFMLFAQKMDKKMMDDPKMDKPMMCKMCPNCQGNMMMMSPENGEMGMNMHEKMMKELNLTKEQKNKLMMMRDEHMKFMNTKKAEMQNLMIDKRNALMNEQFDKAKMINKNISDLQLVIANSMVDNKANMMKELTPEQKDKVKEMMSMMMMKKHMGKGMKHKKGMW